MPPTRQDGAGEMVSLALKALQRHHWLLSDAVDDTNQRKDAQNGTPVQYEGA